jgi:hypothetical protein
MTGPGRHGRVCWLRSFAVPVIRAKVPRQKRFFRGVVQQKFQVTPDP